LPAVATFVIISTSGREERRPAMEASRRGRAIAFKLVLGGNESVGIFRQGRGKTDIIDFKVIDRQQRARSTRIVLKRGIDVDKGLWKWRDRAIRGGPDDARTDAQIELLDYDGTPVATYTIKQAWPSKYTGAGRDKPADDGEVELVEISHEGLKRA
jgi:T4-like virus tail tube protein gp19